MSFSAPKRSTRLKIMKESLALGLQPESKSLKGSGWRSRRVPEEIKRMAHISSSVAHPETVRREKVLKWLMQEHWPTADLSLMCTCNRLCNWRKYAPGANTSLNICLIIKSYEIWYGLHFLILDGTKNPQILIDCYLEGKKPSGFMLAWVWIPQDGRLDPKLSTAVLAQQRKKLLSGLNSLVALWFLVILLPTPLFALFWDRIRR